AVGQLRHPGVCMSLRVRAPELCARVVDHGLPHSRGLGVPVGGAADRSALAVGNALLGNPPDAAALEITLAGPVLLALNPVGAVLAGAPFQLSSGRHTLAANKAFSLESGDELHIAGTQHGARAYLCVVGGVQTPLVLSSRSSLAPVRRDEEIPCAESRVGTRFVRDEFTGDVVPSLSPELRAARRTLRVVPGPQADWFPASLDPAHTYTVTPASNR